MPDINLKSKSANTGPVHQESFNRAVSVASLIDELMPSYNTTVSKLKEIIRMWHLVVGPVLARNSAPYEMKAGVLYIAAASSHSAQQLTLMKGNMQRIIKSRWDIDIEDTDVSVGIKPSVGRKKPQHAQSSRRVVRRKAPNVKADADELLRIRQRIPDSIDDDAADAMANFRLFFEKRFSR